MNTKNENRKKEIIKAIIAILLYLFGTTILLSILDIFHIDLKKLSKTNVLLVDILYEFTMLIIIFLIFKDTIINNAKVYFKYIKGFMRRYIKYWLISLGLTYICNIILFSITKGIANNEESVRKIFDFNPFLMIILGCIIAPILEELIFRLSIFKIFGKNKYLFIVLSGLLFGCAHIISQVNTATDLLYIIPYSIPGITFAYTLYDSNNICVPISLHFLHNSLAFALQIIATILK